MPSSDSQNNPHSVLYYPSIEFESDAWVKKALLFWDHVYRIVPEGYIPQDSDTIKALRSENLVIDIRPTSTQKENTALSFIKFYRGQKYLPAGLSDSGNVLDDPKERLFRDKVDYRLYPLLDKIALESGLEIDDDWVMLPPNFIRGYMFFLSQHIAEERRLVRSTDNLDAWSISPYFTEKGNIPFEDVPYNKKDEGLYCSLIMEDVLPKEVDCIPVSKIIDFNISRKEERCQFRDKISNLVNNLPNIKSKEQWNDEATFLIKEIELAKNDYRKSQEFWNSGMPASVFGVGLPLSFTALFSGDLTIRRIAASLILGIVSTITNYNKIKKERTPSYASYLVGIDKSTKRTLSANSVFNYVMMTLHEFMND